MPVFEEDWLIELNHENYHENKNLVQKEASNLMVRKLDQDDRVILLPKLHLKTAVAVTTVEDCMFS